MGERQPHGEKEQGKRPRPAIWRRVGGAERQPEDQRYKEVVQRVDLGHAGHRPPGGPQGKDNRRQQRTAAGPFVAQARVGKGRPDQPVGHGADQPHGDPGAERVEEVGAPGPLAHREEQARPKRAEQRVERVAGGVGDAQGGKNQLELKRVVEEFHDAGRRRPRIDNRVDNAHNQRRPARQMKGRPLVGRVGGQGRHGSSVRRRPRKA